MPENMQNQTPCSSEVKLQKQVWAGGRASLGPRAASEPVWVSQNPPLRPWRRALGRTGLRERREGNRKQSTESGLKFTVFGGKQQLSTGRLGTVEAAGRRQLPPQRGAGASSCGNKTEKLTELTVFPSLLGGVRGRVPAHLSMQGGGGSSSGSWVGERSV